MSLDIQDVLWTEINKSISNSILSLQIETDH